MVGLPIRNGGMVHDVESRGHILLTFHVWQFSDSNYVYYVYLVKEVSAQGRPLAGMRSMMHPSEHQVVCHSTLFRSVMNPTVLDYTI